MTREEAIGRLEEEKGYYVSYLPAGKKLGKAEEWGKAIEAYEMAIKALKQPEERMAKWILQDYYPVCNKCKGSALRDNIGMAILSEYCPSCGAKMEGEENENKS